MFEQVVTCEQPRIWRQKVGFHLHMAYAPHDRTPHQQGGALGGVS
jgi:hypothetical protein